MSDKRRFELDWLRVIAFTILIYFHAAVFFIPGGLPMIQNEATSEVLLRFVQVSSQFRLALLFFISGVGVSFARRKLDELGFLRERSRRLLIPLLFGLLFIVPPMVYTEKRFLGEFSGSLAEFYPLVLTTGVYPAGNLSWHHFWFIAYLFLFCLLAMFPLRRLDRWSASRWKAFTERVSGYGIYLLIPLLLVPEILLRWLFPGFRDLIHDWASFVLWFIVFMAGYLVAVQISLVDDVIRLRRVSLALALVSTGVMYLWFGTLRPDFGGYAQGFPPEQVGSYIAWCFLRMVMIWCSILSCLGYAGRYLDFSTPALAYLNEAVYPLFILHLTVLVMLGYAIVPLSWALWVKYLVLTSGTILTILVFYHLFIRPFDTMRLLFGVKRRAEAAARVRVT